MIKAILLRKLSKVTQVKRRPVITHDDFWYAVHGEGLLESQDDCASRRGSDVLNLDPPRVIVSDHDKVVSFELARVTTQS